MSNVIPIVSSSPPPLDDDADFKWDDDDDDYGNFTSAPSVSTTTVTSDSSFEVNWSNSETSLSGPDINKVSSVLSESKPLSERDGLALPPSDSNKPESFHVNNDNSHQEVSGSRLPDNGEVVEDDEEFQDFAHFSNAEFSESTSHSAFRIGNKHDSNDNTALSLLTHGGAGDDVVEEDDFQDFAHFNDTAVTESLQISAVDKPDIHEMLQRGNTEHANDTLTIQENTTHAIDTLTIGKSKTQTSDTLTIGENKTDTSDTLTVVENRTDASDSLTVAENKTDASDTLTISSHPNLEGQSLSPDQYSESGPFHMKINDSIYSSISTVDSGVFSAELSPSSHSGDSSDVCLGKEGRIFHKNAVTQQVNTPTSNSLLPGRSLDDAESLEALEGQKDVIETNPDKDTAIICYRIDPSINHYEDNLVSSCDNQSQSQIKDISNPHVDENWGSSVEEKNNIERFSEKEDLSGECNFYNGCHEHSTRVQKVETLSHFISSEQDESHVLHLESSADSPVCSNIVEQVLVDQSGSPAEEDDVESIREIVSLSEGTKPEDEFQAADIDNVTPVVSKGDMEMSAQNEAAEKSDPGSVGAIEDTPNVVCCDIDGNHSRVKEQNLQTEDANKSFLQVTHFADKESSGEEIEEDTEFGEFSFSRGEKGDDPVEVTPITFRTSICETDDNENTDEEDFTFTREKPPVFDNEDGSDSDEFGAFGAVGKNISDDDDFGEFDSAQSFQPKHSASSLDKRVEGDDDFGDFGQSEAADDGTGWADFEATPAPSEGSKSLSSSGQATVPANMEQNKAQKLLEALMSCFPESPVQASSDKVQVDTVTGDESGKHSQNGDSSMNHSTEDEDPLPLDTVVDLGLSKALEAKQQTWTVVLHPAKKDPKVRLWTHLKDVDSCHALMYGWHASHCSKEVYATLHIDTQNILFTQKKQVVPFFASGLGILEPIRGGGDGGGGALERKKDKKNIPAIQPSLLETSKYDNQQSAALQDIPPVDFDWGSSGLTNPLTANTLDLDFLVIQGSDSYEKTSDEWDWVFKIDNQESSPSALQPLEEIMKKTTPTVKLAPNEVLSPEASRVLEKMPDLSFMLSRVLMFPVKQ